ncbi:exodeoxyribonuclease III, partial [Fusobacterium polymorphum]
AAGFIDTFRHFYPDLEHAYSWWSYRANARKNNTGWRIDYFVVSEGLKDNLVDAEIHAQTEGSDHCPVVLFLDLNK